ncbi:MAG TPA: MJ0042-type zinc finger domain-containing protein, partial [Steroidobacteraceae bacterium]|nr:MJ0042-type zinc finger domain-containing protein [Steroidobacteraceae bacterium]
MYTVCPKCALTLVVTAADLRVAQGFVRCGRCSNVFNALARLSEERGTTVTGVASPTLSQPALPPPKEPEPAAPAPSAAERNPPQSLAETDSIPDSALEFNPDATDVTKVFVEQAPDPQWSAATGKFKALFRKSQARAPASTPSEHGTPRAPRSPPASTPPSPSPQPSSPASATRSSAAPSAATPQTIPTDEDAQFDIE